MLFQPLFQLVLGVLFQPPKFHGVEFHGVAFHGVAFAKPLFAHGKFVPKRGVLNAIGPLKPPKPFQPLPPAKPLFQLFCEVAVPPQQSLESKPGQLVQVCVGDQPFGVVLYMRVTPLGALRASRNSRALAWRRDRALVRATLADH